MSETPPVDLIDQFQSDVVARLGTKSFFDDIIVIEERLGTTETEVDEAIAPRRSTATCKPGIAIIVLQPDRDPTGAQSALQWDLELFIRVIEYPEVNRAGGGSKKRASTVSIAIEQLFQNWGIGSSTVLCKKAGTYNDGEGGVGFTHKLAVRFGLPLDPRCKAPGISGTSAAIILSNNEPGAAIYYTLDGTLPAAKNGAQYSTPFTATVGAQVRAAAVLAGKDDSNITEKDITS